MMIFKKYYRIGRKTAIKFVRVMSQQDISSDVKTFLDKVYNDGVSSLALPLQNNLDFINSSIIELEKQIQDFRAKEEYLKSKMFNPDLTGFNDNYEEELNKTTQEISILTKQIDDSQIGLDILQKEFIKENSNKSPIKNALTTTSNINGIGTDIKRLKKELGLLSGSLLLVLVDYGIAVSFFRELAADQGKIVEITLGYVAPLSLTLISMMLMQVSIDQFKKARKTDFNIMDTAFLFIPVVLLIFLFAFMIYMRLRGGDDPINQILVWLLFIGLVIVVGYKLNKEKKEALSLITVPMAFIANLVSLFFFTLLWPFETIHRGLINSRMTPEGLLMKKEVDHLKGRILDYKSEKEKKEKLLRELPKLKSTDKIQWIEFKKKEAKDVFDMEVRKTEALISHAQLELSKHKKTQRVLEEYCRDLRLGFNMGAMTELHKRNKLLTQ